LRGWREAALHSIACGNAPLTSPDREAQEVPEIAAGTCYGLEVHSRLPFRFLRRGAGVPLGVTEAPPTHAEPEGELLVEWPAKENAFVTRLYRDDAGAHLWVDRIGCFDIDLKAPWITVPELPSEDRVGALIWELLERPLPLRALLDTLRARFEDPPAEMADEVNAFLEARGLIELMQADAQL